MKEKRHLAIEKMQKENLEKTEKKELIAKREIENRKIYFTSKSFGIRKIIFIFILTAFWIFIWIYLFFQKKS